MKIPVDEQMLAEMKHFKLRLYCEDCVLFDSTTQKCAHGYPTAPHRMPAQRPEWVFFCKDFEAL